MFRHVLGNVHSDNLEGRRQSSVAGLSCLTPSGVTGQHVRNKGDIFFNNQFS